MLDLLKSCGVELYVVRCVGGLESLTWRGTEGVVTSPILMKMDRLRAALIGLLPKVPD